MHEISDETYFDMDEIVSMMEAFDFRIKMCLWCEQMNALISCARIYRFSRSIIHAFMYENRVPTRRGETRDDILSWDGSRIFRTDFSNSPCGQVSRTKFLIALGFQV